MGQTLSKFHRIQYFCYQAELHATMPHCAVLLFDIRE